MLETRVHEAAPVQTAAAQVLEEDAPVLELQDALSNPVGADRVATPAYPEG